MFPILQECVIHFHLQDVLHLLWAAVEKCDISGRRSFWVWSNSCIWRLQTSHWLQYLELLADRVQGEQWSVLIARHYVLWWHAVHRLRRLLGFLLWKEEVHTCTTKPLQLSSNKEPWIGTDPLLRVCTHQKWFVRLITQVNCVNITHVCSANSL